DGKFEPLAQKNVDTGMGLERTLAALNGLDDNYRADLFWPIIQKIEALSGKKYDEHKKEFRIIADHIKAAVFIIADGVTPSNVGAGYVLRRLIRHAVRYGKMLGIKKSFCAEVADEVIKALGDVYPEIKKKQKLVAEELNKEEERFGKTLEQGMREFAKGTDPFTLFTSYGFPIEMTKELAVEKGQKINEDEFWQKFKDHQDLSRTASAGMFKGGLADASVETTRLHTAAHLMLEALRQTLGDHVAQKGSNITAERLRFDFSHSEKMTPEQIKQVEDIVNEQIAKKLPVHFEEMTVEEAKKLGATGAFEHKYGDKVKVYLVGNAGDPASLDASRGEYFSKEICGGPHVQNTSELGHFKIAKEESSSAGVRRIKAILENN
ncbi:MAG: alanine--tRNA ligase-related protein, partial [Candidatus Parcubacteria bacterium]|nr:alanine--tRNA ligase-related protein [Candidatus Parcubacteria bacterium]